MKMYTHLEIVLTLKHNTDTHLLDKEKKTL